MGGVTVVCGVVLGRCELVVPWVGVDVTFGVVVVECVTVEWVAVEWLAVVWLEVVVGFPVVVLPIGKRVVL